MNRADKNENRTQKLARRDLLKTLNQVLEK